MRIKRSPESLNHRFIPFGEESIIDRRERIEIMNRFSNIVSEGDLKAAANQLDKAAKG
jgi:hypothetical protein